eukprot:1167386-Pyramimonas_sp.AAC.1
MTANQLLHAQLQLFQLLSEELLTLRGQFMRALHWDLGRGHPVESGTFRDATLATPLLITKVDPARSRRLMLAPFAIPWACLRAA